MIKQKLDLGWKIGRNEMAYNNVVHSGFNTLIKDN